MRHSIFYKLFSCFILVVLCGENFDFLIAVTLDAPQTRPSVHHEKCYCSECYNSHEGCLCWQNPQNEETADAAAHAEVYFKACACSTQTSGGTLLLPEMKCLLYPAMALAPAFPLEGAWPADKLLFLTDPFAPAVFHPPEA